MSCIPMRSTAWSAFIEPSFSKSCMSVILTVHAVHSHDHPISVAALATTTRLRKCRLSRLSSHSRILLASQMLLHFCSHTCTTHGSGRPHLSPYK